MKIFLLLIVFILASVAIGFVLDKQFPDWGIKAKVTTLTQQLTGKASHLTGSSNPNDHSQKTMYRWQDAQGQWHFGENPPAGSDATPIKTNKGNTYGDGEANTDKENNNEPKRSPVLFPQFTPAH